MFILINEWLKKNGANLILSCAIDPINITAFIPRYIEISDSPVIYRQGYSTDPSVQKTIRAINSDMVFIDGDHSMKGVMHDHLLVREHAKIIVHHDINSTSCPATTLFWSYIKQAEKQFQTFEFVDFYPSVGKPYLGIGVLRKS